MNPSVFTQGPQGKEKKAAYPLYPMFSTTRRSVRTPTSLPGRRWDILTSSAEIDGPLKIDEQPRVIWRTIWLVSSLRGDGQTSPPTRLDPTLKATAAVVRAKIKHRIGWEARLMFQVQACCWHCVRAPITSREWRAALRRILWVCLSFRLRTPAAPRFFFFIPSCLSGGDRRCVRMGSGVYAYERGIWAPSSVPCAVRLLALPIRPAVMKQSASTLRRTTEEGHHPAAAAFRGSIGGRPRVGRLRCAFQQRQQQQQQQQWVMWHER